MKFKFKLWSNIFFFIPLFLALYYKLPIQSVLILAVIVFSSLFHISNEKKYGILDEIFAIALIAYNFYLLYLSNFRQPHFFLALLFVAMAFYFYYRHKKYTYDLHHSLWHLSSVVVTSLCILASAV